MRLSLAVQNDHLEREAATRPTLAIAELIWNALDADATDVRVQIVRSAMQGIEMIRVVDDGHGIEHAEALSTFERLGGSWKKTALKSHGENRLLHGKEGKGRLRAFTLGDRVVWKTRYSDNSTIRQFEINCSRPELNECEVTEPTVSAETETGTVVEVTNIREFYSLDDPDQVATELARRFALYLKEYPAVRIRFAGVDVDPSSFEQRSITYPLDTILLDDGREVEATLTVIEWAIPGDRALYLCDESGFAHAEIPPGIQAPGWIFTAYLRSSLVSELSEKGALALEDLHPDLRSLIQPAREELRGHFRRRMAEESANLVEVWKKEDVYPYEGEPRDLIESTERQVFDVVALQINEYLPDFATSDAKSRKLSFCLLRQAIEESPESVQRIIQEVLELPEDKQADLVALLEKTTLTAIINASKVVADRLNFLRGLELLLYDPKSREQLLERSQLHKILEEHTWIFGEEFSLSLSDQSLTEVLRKHLRELGRSLDHGDPVLDDEGRPRIVDLMLSRRIPQPRKKEREHLVIELKRPKQAIDTKAETQIKDYARAVARDERFKDTETRWVFWAISNDITENVRENSRQANRPPGLLYESDDLRIRIWVKTWGELIEECRARLEFFQEHLKYNADNESALNTLRELHKKYLPPVLQEDESAQPKVVVPKKKRRDKRDPLVAT